MIEHLYELRGWLAEPWFDARGFSPMYVWQRKRGERGHWPTSVYGNEALVRFTALTFPG